MLQQIEQTEQAEQNRVGKRNGSLWVRVAPFIRSKVLGEEVEIWRGPINGNGWDGHEDRDPSACLVVAVNFDEVLFLNGLRGPESSITGEEKLARLKGSHRTRYGVTLAAGLYKDYMEHKEGGSLESSVLWRIPNECGVSSLDFSCEVFRAADRRRFTVQLTRVDGEWKYVRRYLADRVLATEFSVVSMAQKSLF